MWGVRPLQSNEHASAWVSAVTVRQPIRTRSMNGRTQIDPHGPCPSVEHPRAHLLEAVLAFVLNAKKVPGVLRIAIEIECHDRRGTGTVPSREDAPHALAAKVCQLRHELRGQPARIAPRDDRSAYNWRANPPCRRAPA
jgi:hypothetical protein